MPTLGDVPLCAYSTALIGLQLECLSESECVEAVDVLGSIPAALVLAAGLALLLLGGHWLVQGAVTIARALGVSTLMIGLTVVAFGTSSPELAFNLIAALGGNSDLSFGNVIGSNIANIALVLGLSALVTPLPVHSRVIWREIPLLVFIALALLGAAYLRYPGSESAPAVPWAFGRLEGGVMLLAFAVAVGIWFQASRREAHDALASVSEEEARETQVASRPLAVVLFLLGLGSLVLGGKLAENGAVRLARWAGVSDALIGLTVVALATSLPEIVTSVVAARKGHGDLAVGNVVGSNVFNVLLILGITSVAAPVHIPPGRGWWDLGFHALLTALLFPLATTGENSVKRAEGALLVSLYASYMIWSVWWELG